MEGTRLKTRRAGTLETRPGDYWKTKDATPYESMWIVCLPNGAVAGLEERYYKVIEHDDGTITVTRPIVWEEQEGRCRRWAGTLERGIFTTIDETP